MRKKGIAAAQIGHSDAENDAVISGQATVIYGSREMLLDNDLWRRTVACPSVKPRLAALVVDEVHMFHSGSAVETKECILESLAEENGVCRVVICTSALGMGVNVKGLTTVVHYGPPTLLMSTCKSTGEQDATDVQARLSYCGIGALVEIVLLK